MAGAAVSVAGSILSNAAIAKIGVNCTASFIGVATAVSILAGVAFLGERFTLPQAAGTAAILFGVLVANLGPRRGG